MDPRTYTVNIGDSVRRGQILGRVAVWPAEQNGHKYHHVHMNVVRPNAAWLNADGQFKEGKVPLPYVDGWTY